MNIKYGYARKSDCIITLDLNKEVLDIYIDSKVKKLFKKHIEKAIREAFREMNIIGGNVYIEDYGALDFVIKARTKTAIKQALKRSEISYE